MIRSLNNLRLICLCSAMLLSLAACDDDEGTPGGGGPSDGGSDAADAARSDAADTATPGGADAGIADAVSPDAVVGDAGPDGGGGDGGVVLTPQQQRGSYLVNVVIGCPDCHTPRKEDGSLDMTKFMAGETAPFPLCIFKSQAPGSMDCLHPRNLTNDPTGLQNRTPEEIKKMLREGKRPAPTGDEALFPVMPYYVFANMAEADLDAIIAYLRTIAGVKNEIPKRGESFNIPQPVPGLTLAKVPLPSETYPQKEAAMRGRYLTSQSGLCIECHSKHLPMGPTALDEAKLFQGGEDFTGLLGPMFTMPIRTLNLTPDPTTGLGNWTVDEIVKALKLGVDKMGKGLCPPMPSGMFGYGRLTDQDATDIAHYLKSIPPAVNAVQDECSLPAM